MSRISYFIALVASIMLFNSCYGYLAFNNQGSESPQSGEDKYIFKNAYGPYLSGRVAHLRREFGHAADYYSLALEKDQNNPDLLSRTYIILASEGRISEAAKYSEIAIKKGDKNNFTHIIIAVDKMKRGEFAQANTILSKLRGPVYKEFITPLLTTWAWAGQGNKKNAFKNLDSLKKEPAFLGLYHFHAGMLNDFFGNIDAARKHYETIINNENMEMSLRALQIITNFYIRIGKKEEAITLVTKYNDSQTFRDMLETLRDNIEKSVPDKTPKLIAKANDGLAEALFNIAATLKQGENGLDIAHVFISLAIHANPTYDLAKILLSDLLEKRELYRQAIDIYDQITPASEAYFSASVKKAGNFTALKEYSQAEKILRKLTKKFDKNPQLYFDLGDVLRMQKKYREAIKYYNLSLEYTSEEETENWVTYYTLGIAYDQDGQTEKATESLQKALELSQNHFLVLNYLGYTWIREGKNIDKALGLLIEAYLKAPHDGNIIDSLGFAFYRIGQYDESIKYLEIASELEPASAVIYDHLGDAYWQKGRKIEAVFQWKHALDRKDDSGEVIREEVESKIKHGMSPVVPLDYDKDFFESKLKSLKD